MIVWAIWKTQFQKLSIDQRRWLKKILDTSQLTLQETQSKFNISYSVLNRIKRCSPDWLCNQYSRRVIKLSNKQKLKVIKLIRQYKNYTMLSKCKRSNRLFEQHSEQNLLDKLYSECWWKPKWSWAIIKWNLGLMELTWT